MSTQRKRWKRVSFGKRNRTISGREWLVGTEADMIKQQRMALIIWGLSFTQSQVGVLASMQLLKRALTLLRCLNWALFSPQTFPWTVSVILMATAHQLCWWLPVYTFYSAFLSKFQTHVSNCFLESQIECPINTSKYVSQTELIIRPPKLFLPLYSLSQEMAP